MFDGRANLSIQVVDGVKDTLKECIYDANTRNVRLAEAPSHGKPVIYYDSKCKGASIWNLEGIYRFRGGYNIIWRIKRQELID